MAHLLVVPEAGEGTVPPLMDIKVLVVDDEPDIRMALRLVLEDEGYTVYEAPDGVSALDRLRDHPEGLVVLLDLNMPGVNGIEVMRAVAAHEALATRHAYVIMTANDRTVPLAFAQQLTHMDVPVLAKPFDIEHLLEAVGRAGQRLV